MAAQSRQTCLYTPTSYIGFDYCMVKVNSRQGSEANARLRTQTHHQNKQMEYNAVSNSLKTHLSGYNTSTNSKPGEISIL